jgi:hypothetical protein
LQLLLGRQIIVSIDANDKGDALGGRWGAIASNAAARQERKIVARRMASSQDPASQLARYYPQGHSGSRLNPR